MSRHLYCTDIFPVRSQQLLREYLEHSSGSQRSAVTARFSRLGVLLTGMGWTRVSLWLLVSPTPSPQCPYIRARDVQLCGVIYLFNRYLFMFIYICLLFVLCLFRICCEFVATVNIIFIQFTSNIYYYIILQYHFRLIYNLTLLS